MRVLLIGSGGREHAIAWKLLQSPRLTQLFVAPGNAGTAQIAVNVDLRVPPGTASAAEVAAYLEAVVRLARARHVDLVFVAPDDPLAWGLVDALQAAGIAAFGPSRAAARLEASKSWAKALMQRHGVPHTPTKSFDDVEAAKAYVRAVSAVVVKADGLAVGKGAIVTSTTEEALIAIDELRTLGEAGKRLTIEPRVTAREVSGHAFSDGRTVAVMPLSCDHKAVFDGNRGPNTGGMAFTVRPGGRVHHCRMRSSSRCSRRSSGAWRTRARRVAASCIPACSSPTRECRCSNVMLASATPRRRPCSSDSRRTCSRSSLPASKVR